MQNNINSIYVNNNLSLYNTNKNNNVENPHLGHNGIPQAVSFRGTEALAAYNYSLVNKEELFNLPVLKPLDIPIKIEEINGEKIYNSNGEVVRIISDDNNRQTTYHVKDNIVKYSITKENNSDTKWETFYNNGEIEGISKILADGTEYSNWYKDGKPVQITKYKQFADGNDIELEYLPENGEYSVSKHYTENGKQYSSFAYYDKNKTCTEAFESEGMHDELTNLYLIDGKPYGKNTNKSQSIDFDAGKDDIDLTNLEPSPFYNIDVNKINSIDGEKKYYSNGKIEKIISQDGDIYTFLPEGTLSAIESKDKKIEFGYSSKDNELQSQNITELMPDGGVKTTQYSNSPDDGFDIWYDNKGIEKHVLYNNKGNIISYSNNQEGKKEIARDYDDNGNLIKCWDE